jgi:hypothetical protein
MKKNARKPRIHHPFRPFFEFIGKKEIAVIQIIVRHKSPRQVFGDVTGERE